MESAGHIVIRPEDLADPRVDEQLARQLSFGMAGAPPRVEDAKTSLIQRPWFALMIAGLLGALAGWGVIEPLVDDGLRFRGTVEQLELAGGGPVVGRMRVGGLTVWVPKLARVVGPHGPGAASDLGDGQEVEVRGQLIEKGDAIVAHELRIRGPGGPPARIDVRNLLLKHSLVALLVFPLLAAFVGLFIGAADGLLSRALRRSAICGLVGLGIGFAAGLVAGLFAHFSYGIGAQIAESFSDGEGGYTAVGFLLQMVSRGIAWSLAGAAMGLGQGVALRSKKLALNGLLGGMVGALLGGLLFDPIYQLISGGRFGVEASASRAVGFAVIGIVTGLMIGVVELMAREAWIKLLTGSLAGKEFVLYKNPTLIGSSPKSDIYLFKDAEVEPTHAAIRSSGEGYEIEDRGGPAGTFINGRRVVRRRLESGDQVRIGKTVFNFTEKDT